VSAKDRRNGVERRKLVRAEHETAAGKIVGARYVEPDRVSDQRPGEHGKKPVHDRGPP